MADEKTKIEVVYLGRRTLTTGKTAYAYAVPEAIDAKLGREPGQFETAYPDETTLAVERLISLFDGKGGAGTIGAIYSATGTIVDGRVNTLALAGMQYVRPGDYPLMTAWRALDRDVELKKQLKSREKAAEDDTALTNAMSTIRYRYKLIPPQARRGFKLWLLEELDKRK